LRNRIHFEQPRKLTARNETYILHSVNVTQRNSATDLVTSLA